MKREKISDELRNRVLRRDKYTCRYCCSDEGPFHLDHVYPFSKGGATTYENLVTACPRCNIKKHAKVGVWPLPIVPSDKVVRRVKHTRKDRNKQPQQFVWLWLIFNTIGSFLIILPSWTPGPVNVYFYWVAGIIIVIISSICGYRIFGKEATPARQLVEMVNK